MFLCSVLPDTYTFFKDLKFENIPSFVLHTVHLIHLAQDRRKFSMFCPPRYLYFFMDLKSKNIPSFVLHTFYLIFVSMFCPTFFKDLKFENIPSFVPHTFHLIHLAQDRR